MADAEEGRRVDELVEGLVGVPLALVQDGGEAEEEGGEEQIAARHDQPQPLQLHFIVPACSQLVNGPSENIIFAGFISA